MATESSLEVTENCVESNLEDMKQAVTATQSAVGIEHLQRLSDLAGSDLLAELTTVSREEKGVRELLNSFPLAETNIPDYYIQPEHFRQQAAPADSSYHVIPTQHHVPAVDLASSREDLVTAMGKACERGFFQIINHGISVDLLQKITNEADEFFELPVEEKLRCTTPAKMTGPIHFGGGSRGDWRDVLRIIYAPASEVAVERWPRLPVGFTETLMDYATQQRALVKTLFEIISESLGLEKRYVEAECEDPRFLLVLNHYPPSPDPTVTMGIREHSDPNTITILLQRDDVVGLQVYEEPDGVWVDVKHLEDALVVNVGDHLQILANGRYPSCLHRVVNNKWKARTSIGLFVSPPLDAHIEPSPPLIDDEHPALYRQFVYSEFLSTASYSYHLSGGSNKKVSLSKFQTPSERIT